MSVGEILMRAGGVAMILAGVAQIAFVAYLCLSMRRADAEWARLLEEIRAARKGDHP